MKELEEGGFIRSYLPFENLKKHKTETKKNIVYQLVDLYSLFYLRFVKEANYKTENFWSSNYTSPQINSWRGFSFETLAVWHQSQIKVALGISGIHTRICAWMGKNEDGDKAQIDMLIDRVDGMINICEMKWSSDLYVISKSYASELQRKLDIFCEVTKTKKTPVLTMIVTHGIKLNSYRDYAQQVVILSQLFKY